MLDISSVFEGAHTCSKFTDQKIDKTLLEKIYTQMKFGPTSANCCPLRIVFLQSEEQKNKLASALMEGNIEKTKAAPIVALFAQDMKFYTEMARLFPHNPGIANYFSSSEILLAETALRNSSLQAAYFMIVARSFGLGCGPMSGFNPALVNELFFAGSSYKINFICNLGYPAEAAAYPRLPRLEFEEACKIL